MGDNEVKMTQRDQQHLRSQCREARAALKRGDTEQVNKYLEALERSLGGPEQSEAHTRAQQQRQAQEDKK